MDEELDMRELRRTELHLGSCVNGIRHDEIQARPTHAENKEQFDSCKVDRGHSVLTGQHIFKISSQQAEIRDGRGGLQPPLTG